VNIRQISYIVIISLIIITFNLSCVLAYDETINFDHNYSQNLTNCGRILWYPDSSSGYGSAPALRSGPIRNSGMSCIGKYVDGPANLQFYWKLDQYSQIGELSFNVDNYTVILCTSSDWASVSYAIAPGMHWISWEYKKQYSYPEFVGVGWIDDLIIVSNNSEPEKIFTNFADNDSIKAINQNLNLFDRKLSTIEKNLSNLNKSVNITINSINKSIDNINNTLYNMGADISDLNESLKAKISSVNQHIEEIDKICARIANTSQGVSVSDDLSWIHDRVIFVSDEKSNLTDIVLKNKNKIIILNDGVYKTNSLWITSGDVYLRSFRKWGAKLDAENRSNGIVIDTANNVTLDSLVITNCTDGIHIENSSNCNIINNLVDFNRIGITIINSNQSTFMLNSLMPHKIKMVVGIQMLNSFNNTFALNNVNIGLSDNKSYLFESQFSKDNTIYISNSGRIWEDNLPNNDRDEFSCEIWDSTFNCWLCKTRAPTDLSGSENIWIFPNTE
jgi:parallel beta-helix repeat protein